jgi:hypothetical protein
VELQLHSTCLQGMLRDNLVTLNYIVAKVIVDGDKTVDGDW